MCMLVSIMQYLPPHCWKLSAYPVPIIPPTCLCLTAPSPARSVTITRVLQDGVELNWLPPTEPNGEVHYVIEYKREDSGNWTSVNTTSDSTHYNLTGLHSGTNYTVRVVAVNSAGRAPTTVVPTSGSATVSIAVIVTCGVAAFLVLLTLLTASVVIGVVLRRAKQRKGKYTFKSEVTMEERVESPANSREQQEGAAAALHSEIAAQQVEDHYECTDALGPGLGELTGVRPAGDYDEIVNRDAFPAKKEAKPDNKVNRQLADKPTSTPIVVYAEVDKSKKSKQKTHEGPHGTTTHDLHTEAPGYEFSNVLEENWFECVVEETSDGSHDEAVKGAPYNEAKANSPKPEPCKPNSDYTVVDKSKKRSKRKENDVPSLTAEQAVGDKVQQQNSNGREVCEAFIQPE